MNTHGCRPCGHRPTTTKYTHSGTLHIPFEDSNTTLPPNVSLMGLWVNSPPAPSSNITTLQERGHSGQLPEEYLELGMYLEIFATQW